MADAMCAAGAESLMQVMCTELVSLRRLVEAATVRGGHSVRYIRTILLALDAVGDGGSNDDHSSESDCLIIYSSYGLPIIIVSSFSTSFFLTSLQYCTLLLLLVLHRVTIESSRC